MTDTTTKTRSLRVHVDEDLYRRVSTHAGALGLTVQRAIVATLAAYVPLYEPARPRRCDHSGIGLPGCATCDARPHKTGMAALEADEKIDPLLAAAGITKRGTP